MVRLRQLPGDRCSAPGSTVSSGVGLFMYVHSVGWGLIFFLGGRGPFGRRRAVWATCRLGAGRLGAEHGRRTFGRRIWAPDIWAPNLGAEAEHLGAV